MPRVQRQRRSCNEMVGGHNHDKFKSHTCHVGYPQTGKQKYQRSSPTVVKFLNLVSSFPAWRFNKGTGNTQGIWPWRPVWFDFGLPTDWRRQKLQSWRSQTKSCIRQGLEENSSVPTGDNQKYLLVLEGLLWRYGLSGAHHRDGNTGNRSPRSPYALGVSPLGSHH